MLVIEKSQNGKPIVVFKRDWHPGRVSCQYVVKQLSQSRPRWLDADAMRMRDVVLSFPKEL